MAEEITQFNDVSSWRQTTEVIKAGETKTIDFIDTLPNIFVLQNNSGNKLHISISSLPTFTSYEFESSKVGYSVFGRPIPTRQIYILNTASTDCTIKIYSINDVFDVNILKSFHAQMGDISLENDGIIKGFQADAELPRGNNVIGKVGFDEIERTILLSIQEICGNIESNLESYIKDSTDKQILFSGNIPEESGLIADYINGGTSFNKNYSCNRVMFKYLINDGADLVISRTYQGTTEEILTLKAGESITDLVIEVGGNGVDGNITFTSTNLLFRAKTYGFTV